MFVHEVPIHHSFMAEKSINYQRIIYKLSKVFHAIQYFYFLLPISRESIILGSNFRSGDFDGFT